MRVFRILASQQRQSLEEYASRRHVVFRGRGLRRRSTSRSPCIRHYLVLYNGALNNTGGDHQRASACMRPTKGPLAMDCHSSPCDSVRLPGFPSRAFVAFVGLALCFFEDLSTHCSNPGSVGFPCLMRFASVCMSSIVRFRAPACIGKARDRS